MPNRSNYESKLLRDESPGAAPLGSRDFYEKVNPYWLDQGARLKAQATSRKRQASSVKQQAGRVGPQAASF